MGLSIERNNARLAVAIKEEHNISGDLNNLEPGMKKAAGGAVEKTTRLRIDVFRFRRIVDMSFQILLLSSGPRLVGNLAIGRIHHPACFRNSWGSGTDSKQFVEASTPGPRIGDGLEETVARMQVVVDSQGLAEPVTDRKGAAKTG